MLIESGVKLVKSKSLGLDKRKSNMLCTKLMLSYEIRAHVAKKMTKASHRIPSSLAGLSLALKQRE